MTSIRLREFKLADYDAVYVLWQNAGPGIGIGRSDTPEEIARKLERDPDLFLLAVESDKIVGTVIGGFDGRRGLIYHLAVDPTYRRRGIGKLLMREIEQRLVAKGCLRCYLLVKDDARDVIGFYRGQGWDTFGTTVLAKTIA
jgi:ribosomal protein S18 acetylase RimI-like enzyme